MRLTIEELFDGFEVAADMKKILLVFAGTLLGWLCFMFFVWAGGFVKSDLAFGILSVVGYILNYGVCTFALGASNRMVYKELTTGESLSPAEGIAFARKNLGSILFSPAAIFIIVAAVLAVEFAVFMLGRFDLIAVVLSLLTAPAIMLNAVLLACAMFGSVLTLAVIAVDESGIAGTVAKIYTLVRKASIPLIMYMSLALLLGIAATMIIALIFVLATVISVMMFGGASQIFINLSAMEVPALSLPLQAATVIGFISIYVLAAMVFTYPVILLQSFATSIYLKIKEHIK